jgi:hypothetical protein
MELLLNSIMRARTVNEAQNFERGQDPKKYLGLGLDPEKYIKVKLKEKGFDVEKNYKEFLDLYYEGFRDMALDEIGDHVLHILDEGIKDPRYMFEYLDNELDTYFQMKEEFGEMP